MVPKSENDGKSAKLGEESINRQRSQKPGLLGLLETLARKVQALTFVLVMLPLIGLYLFCLTGALFPGVYLGLHLKDWISQQEALMMALSISFVAAVGIIAFIIGLLVLVPIANAPFLPFIKSYRGPWFSFDSIPWMYHNSLAYLVRYTVLDLVTPSPLATWYLKAMGMKIGKGSMINTSNISDPALIEVGDYVTIGGSVYMMAHYGMKGFLIIDKLKIERKANVGLHAYLMGAVHIGEAAQILPNSIVLPKTQIPAGTRYSNYPNQG